eukprot:scaffold14691_cov152-Skeletonema_dohrnii-CCMP3373.AAC.3
MTKIFSRGRYSAAIVNNTVKRAVQHSPKSDTVGRSIGYRTDDVLRLTGYLLRSYQINPSSIVFCATVCYEVFNSHLRKCSEC